MGDPYSARLGTGTTTADGTVITLATVPAGRRWIVRDIIWSQTQTGSARGRLTATNVNGNLDLTDVLAQNASVARTERHMVFYAGESITFRAQNTTTPIVLSCTLYGYDLDAP